MKLSKNFSLAELTKSQTAERMGLENNPSEDETENLRILCERVLQPVRDHFNHTVTISSGFRNEILSAKNWQFPEQPALQRRSSRLRNLWYTQ